MEFTTVVTLGKRSDPARISHRYLFGGIDVDSKGQFYVVSDNATVIVFDAQGNFLRQIGREGEGPGEFSSRDTKPIDAIAVIPGDTLVVFHPPRVSRFSPRHEFIRTDPFMNKASNGKYFPTRSGNWVIPAQLRTPEAIGRVAHLVDKEGTYIRSLGPEKPVVPNRAVITPPVQVAFSPRTEALWFFDNYTVEEWSVGGQQLRAFRITDVPFLPTPTYVTRQGARGSYQTPVGEGSATAIGVDSSLNVWVFGRGPQTSAMAPPPDGNRPGTLNVVSRTGSILIAQEVGGAISLLPNRDLVSRASIFDDGHVTLRISTYRIAR